MTALPLLETALAPADLIRRRILSALGPVAGRLAGDREARVAVAGVSLVLTAWLGAMLAPLWLLALGPIVLGVPHLLADVRYLWVRPGLHRSTAAWALVAGPIVLGALTSSLEIGLLGAAGAALVADGAWRRRVVVFAAVASAAGAAMLAGRVADIVLAHLHNVVAVLLFWGWRKRSGRLHYAFLAAFAIATLLLAAGVGTSGWSFTDEAGGLTLRHHAATLARGLPPEAATRLVLLFCFAQSVHYGIWLRLVPEEDRAQKTPRTFAASARALVGDLGWAPLVGCLVLAAVFVGWAVLDLAHARAGYFRFANLHAELELAALAWLWVRGSKPQVR